MKNGDQPINRGSNFPGLTKREHFAGLAMQGLIAGPWSYGDKKGYPSRLTQDALNFADALLEAIDQPEEAL